jgi:hypothetical protein
MFLMDGVMTGIEQRDRLAAAYHKMTPRGRDALDRILRRLARIDGTVGPPKDAFRRGPAEVSKRF